MSEPLDPIDGIRNGMKLVPHAFDSIHRELLDEVDRLTAELQVALDRVAILDAASDELGDEVERLTAWPKSANGWTRL